MRIHWKTFWLLTCLAASPAAASGERIVVLSASQRGAEYAAQLATSLCVSMECVSEARVLSGGRADYAKVSREQVVAVVSSRMVRERGVWGVEVALRNKSGGLVLSTTVPAASDGKLSVTEVVAASAKVISAIEFPPAKLQAEAKKSSTKKWAKKSMKGKSSRYARKRGVHPGRVLASR
ncbi:MAG: hypothetical protein ACOZIN_22110 [Myxococcota bacterium]